LIPDEEEAEEDESDGDDDDWDDARDGDETSSRSTTEGHFMGQQLFRFCYVFFFEI
jgi:hypothetical protein